MQRVIRVLMIGFACAMAAQGGERSQVSFQGVDYEVYRCMPEEVQLFWKDEDGRRYGQFRALNEAMARRGESLVFAMNAGIFRGDDEGLTPCGLHMEEGRQVVPLSLEPGEGNFYLKPNGVFMITGARARVVDSIEFRELSMKPRAAVQSGPLLLRRDRIHPAFNAGSTSRLHRNGVGVARDGKVVFAMTKFDPENRVNLHGFAEFFRSLDCEDALFLDGDISAMWTPEDGPAPAGNHFAAIFGVLAEKER